MKKISLIVPVYNSITTLERCLKSMINQKYKDIEIILINDGSEDNSLQIIKEYAKRDSRIVIINQNNRGVSTARNVGIEKSTGEYIIFIDSDDYLEENSVDGLINILKNDNADLYIMPYYKEEKGKKEFINYSFLKNKTYDTKEKICRIIPNFIGNVDKEGNRIQNIMGSIWSKVFKSDIIKRYNIRMNEKIEITEDLNFLIEYMIHCDKIKIMNYYFYNYVIENNKSITKKYKANLYNELELSLNNIVKILKENSIFFKNVIKYKRFYNIYASLVNECKSNTSIKNKQKNILKFTKSLKDNKMDIQGLSKKEKIIKFFLERNWIIPLILYYSK